MCVCARACAQLCLTLCDPMDCSPPGSPVHGILQAGILELGGSSQSWDEPESLESPALADGFFSTAPSGKGHCYLYFKANFKK